MCHDAVISAGCQLKDCLISGSFKVSPGGNFIDFIFTIVGDTEIGL